MEARQIFPIFEEGRLLKKEALDLIRDYAPEYFSLLFGEYGDGVVAGFQIREAGGRITVSPGILKDSSGFFCMNQEARLDFDRYGEKTRIVIKKSGSSESPDFRTDSCRLFLDPVKEPEKGEYELGRFCLERGAKLRSYGEYQDFPDLTTEFNTLNLIHVRYACPGGSSFLPLVLRLYGRGVLRSPKAEPLDLAFAAECLSSQRITGELIKNYLYIREKTGCESDGNREWYQSLRRLYTRLAGSGEIRPRPSGGSRKTVID